MAQLNAPEYAPFEKLKHRDEFGNEYWLARELAPVLEYSTWHRFQDALDRAMLACSHSKIPVQDHFSKVGKMIEIGKGGRRTVKDYRLSRYACYLVVQNGDPRKEVIALGQTYFAIQTRRQEIADAFNALDEDSKRLVVRGDVRHWNLMLADAAEKAGVKTSIDYAAFQNAGYQGLYGGLTAKDIHKRKRLKKTQKILDHMGSEELAANLFRITQTEAKMRREEPQGLEPASGIHRTVGSAVRSTIVSLGGTMPEDLPTPEKSIGQIEREQLDRIGEEDDDDPALGQ
ncbi:DNA damage-inducible protein D [Gordonibacter sp. 28C]|uniref:DNA damage-inducible protein D n=1 Tax=Gordonibacter sp. 28C TaxID=2078569 RepID=UPI000DF86301|nr:DNA damage-inducible protein D [Gordonibacter sp. 28C]RDB61998.1 DNA damage-inducible protein D [Gordonibacter sp. 28C]